MDDIEKEKRRVEFHKLFLDGHLRKRRHYEELLWRVQDDMDDEIEALRAREGVNVSNIQIQRIEERCRRRKKNAEDELARMDKALEHFEAKLPTMFA